MAAPSLTAYATPQDLQVYYDWHEIGELITDSNEVISANDQFDTSKQGCWVVIRALNRGAGEIDTNLMVSGMYSLTDLQNLTGNSKEKLIGINCDLAMCVLMERKPLWQQDKIEAYRKSREELLKNLRTGVNVFNLPAQINAGTPEVSGPSIAENANSGLVAYKPNMQYFPTDTPIYGNG
jgi:hypothetical protein